MEGASTKLKNGSKKTADKQGGEKRSRPSRKKLLAELEKLREALEEERERSQEYLSQIKYLQADFDNYSKRLKRDVEERVREGNEQLISKLLPIIDDLEKAIEVSECEHSPLQDGVKMILKQLKNILSEESLSEIEVLGKSFDPTKHEAMGQIETSEYPEGVVVKVLRKGYIIDGRVLRPSLVEVSKRVITSKDDHEQNDRGAVD